MLNFFGNQKYILYLLRNEVVFDEVKVILKPKRNDKAITSIYCRIIRNDCCKAK